MKDKLVQIFNAMMQVETKGNSTYIMANCLKELQNVINTAESEEQNELRD